LEIKVVLKSRLEIKEKTYIITSDLLYK